VSLGLQRREDDRIVPHEIRARTFTLPDGHRLLVGRDMYEKTKFRNTVVETLAWSLAATVVLGLIGGLFVSRRMLRRVDQVTHTAQGIMQGDLSRRMRKSGSDDEFDRLAESLNAMLDQIERLMTGMRWATESISVKVVRLQLEGETFPRLQMTTPEPPFEGGKLRETLLVDLENNRMRLDQRTGGFGFAGDTTVAIVSGQGTIYDHRARTATPIPAAQATQQQFIQYYRRLPNLLLRQALDRANTLRHLGEESYEGRRHDVITFVMPDAVQVAVYVDAASGLVSKYELIFVDPLTGVEASEIRYGDYRKVGAYQVPGTFTNSQAGEVVAKFSLRAEFNPEVSAESFAFKSAGYREVAAAPTNRPEEIEKLADGVYVIQNVAGQNQNTLAVEFADHVVAVEAPGSSDGSEAVIKRVNELIPGKPIRYIVMTHHHGDHIGGLRSYIAEGATVITTPGNRGVVERTAAAPQNDRLRKNPRPVQVETISGKKRVLTDGTRTLELIDIGPHPHAKEMVIAWLPGERVVFQGDLFSVPANHAPFGPPQPSTVAFAKKLRALRLPVEHIAGVHGATATIAQFNEATAGVR
jgi:glyoxylase-like metal-dependent hydrolase (beta-lactamase superfamily II)/HAMP domain-containing protein